MNYNHQIDKLNQIKEDIQKNKLSTNNLLFRVRQNDLFYLRATRL